MDNNLKCFIEVNGLMLRGHHGVMPEEAVTGNTFRIDLRLEYPFAEALESDELSHTLSYAEVIDVVKECMAIRSALLERVVGRIRRRLLERFPNIAGGKIRLAKQTPPIDAIVSDCAVTVEW